MAAPPRIDEDILRNNYVCPQMACTGDEPRTRRNEALSLVGERGVTWVPRPYENTPPLGLP